MRDASAAPVIPQIGNGESVEFRGAYGAGCADDRGGPAPSAAEQRPGGHSVRGEADLRDEQREEESPAYYHGPDVSVPQRRDRLKVVPYTVDDPAIMQRVVDLGADGISTDNPDLLVSVVIRNGLR
ncbi:MULTISPECIES: glycerophosphodiester phosphodiesterase family protein [unclassified Micromonospora]|uniref:glycerophosphodiester phosphodiesterase family protein n=1 Tax=unclassified Micromonospora TaxID=2617518 RepID=UPI0033B2BD0B